MDFLITQQQVEIQEAVKAFAHTYLNHDVAFRDRQQLFDRSLWAKLGDLKMQGLCIPEEYGGKGYDPLTTVLALEALGEGCEDGGLCFALGAHLFACCVPIWLYGSQEQKKKYLPKLCDGTWIAGNAMTEPSSGSDAYELNTTASMVEDAFELHGCKTYISNGPVADFLVTYACTDVQKGFFGGITAFLLDLSQYDVELTAAIDKMGVRTCQMGEAKFDKLKVNKDAVIGKPGAGGMIFNRSMEWERTCLGAIHLGAMQRVLNNTIQFVKQRNSGGKPIGEYQAISHQLASLKVRLEAARLMTYQAAWKLEQSKGLGMEASSIKLFVSETFREFAMAIFQIYAGKAFRENHEAERLVRDAMGSTIYSGTSEIQRNIIAKLMGI